MTRSHEGAVFNFRHTCLTPRHGPNGNERQRFKPDAKPDVTLPLHFCCTFCARV
jgi:hypothetical protein